MGKLTYSAISLSLLYSGMISAELAEKQGISGEVSINTGYMSSTSNFNTDGEKIKTGELNTAGSSESDVAFTPLGSLQYTFGTGLDKQFYIGTSRDDVAVGDFALELGYSQEFAYGTVVSVSYVPSIMAGETWADPYLTGTERKTTDQSTDAFRLKLSTIAGTGLSLDLAFATTEIEEEKSGSVFSATDQKLLDRNGNSIYIKAEYKSELDRTSALVPSLTYISHSADGEAMAFSSYRGELTYYKLIDRHLVAVTAGYGHSAYDAINPLFNKTRSDNSYGLFVAYEYNSVFGWNDWSFVSFAGYGKNASNIEFYDEKGYLALVGMNYKF